MFRFVFRSLLFVRALRNRKNDEQSLYTFTVEYQFKAMVVVFNKRSQLFSKRQIRRSSYMTYLKDIEKKIRHLRKIYAYLKCNIFIKYFINHCL